MKDKKNNQQPRQRYKKMHGILSNFDLLRIQSGLKLMWGSLTATCGSYAKEKKHTKVEGWKIDKNSTSCLKRTVGQYCTFIFHSLVYSIRSFRGQLYKSYKVLEAAEKWLWGGVGGDKNYHSDQCLTIADQTLNWV